MKITVRRAAQQDAVGLFKLCVGMHEETVYRVLSFNPEKCLAQIFQWIDSALVVVAIHTREDSSEDVIGMLVAIRAAMWFSDEELAGEKLLYVRPDARGSRAAVLLGREYIAWGKQLPASVKMLAAGITTGDFPGAGRLYEHLGLKNVGGNYAVDLDSLRS